MSGNSTEGGEAEERSAGEAGAVLPASVRIGLWMSLSGASFAVMVGFVRHLSPDIDAFVISFWRNLFGSLVFIPWFLHVGIAGLRTQRPRLYLVRSLLMVSSTILLFLGVTLMPLADATALSFSSPLFSTALAVLILRETVGPARWSALFAGFLGVLVILRPGGGAIDPAALVILGCSLTFAGVVITGKMLAATESPELIVLYLSVFSVPLSLLAAVPTWQWPNLDQLLMLFGVSAAAVANMYGISRALRIGDASVAMPFDFVRLLFTAAVGYLMFAERPDLWTWVGALLIFGSAVFVAHREAVRARKVRQAD